jgi:hypothetical protein
MTTMNKTVVLLKVRAHQHLARESVRQCSSASSSSTAVVHRDVNYRLRRRLSTLVTSFNSCLHAARPFSSVTSTWSMQLMSAQHQRRYLRCTQSIQERGSLTANYSIRNYDCSSSTNYTPNYDDDDDIEVETPDSLHSRIHYILKKIPIGHMNDDDLADARAFLSIVSKWHNEKGAMLAEALLERLHKEKFHGRQNNLQVVIDSEMYNICMDAWNKSNAVGEKIVHRVESIMTRMEERFFNGHHGNDTSSETTTQQKHQHFDTVPRPDRFGYNSLINAYSKWDGDSSEKVEAILIKINAFAKAAASSSNAIEREYEERIRPDTITYNSAMNYYASRMNNRGAAQKAEDLLLHMSELSKQGHVSNTNSIQVNTISFNIVLKAWSNSGGGIHGAQRAEAVLRMMMKLHGQGHENIKPDAYSFSTVINSYSNVNPDDVLIAVEKVMDLLEVLEGSFISTSDAININSCYNAAANVIVKNGVEDAVLRIEELMNRMKNLDAAPDSNMLTSLCIAYISEGSDKSFQRGKDLLVEMMNDPESNFEPNSIPFNALLASVLKSESADKLNYAEELMAAMDGVGGNARPDLTSYSMIISALSRSTCDNSEEKAVEYMRKMLKSYRGRYEKAKPDSFVFNCIISMLARSKHDWADNVIYRTLKAMESQQARGNTSVVPDTITYNMVIGKLAQKKTVDNAKKMMTLLKHMEDNSLANRAIAPDIITYTNALQIQSKLHPQMAADMASSYLERTIMSREKVQIDQLGFRTLLLALSGSYKFEHAVLAHKAWEWMEKSDRGRCNVLNSSLCNLVFIAYSKTNDSKAAEAAFSFIINRIDRWTKGEKTVIFPTVVGLGAAIVSLGKQKRIDNALRLLEQVRLVSDEGVPDIKPDAGCYVNILRPLAHNQAAYRADQALRIAKCMKEDIGTVSTEALNLAIDVCSKRVGSQIDKRKALEAAFLLFQLGRESSSCDTVTYGLMIRACINLTEEEDTRTKLVEVSCISLSSNLHLFQPTR